MAKTLKEAPLTTRNARAKLPAGLHWRGIDTEVHLGYRKGKRGGVWLARWRNGAGYRQSPLGAADDEISEGTLSFGDAVKAAREHVEKVRREDRAGAEGEVQTVRTAVEVYLAVRDARDRARRGEDARCNGRDILERCVIGREARGGRLGYSAAPLAEIPLHELTEADLIAWRGALPGSKVTTRKRIISDLRAALNACYISNRHKLPAALPVIIAGGLRAEDTPDTDTDVQVARENQILSDAVIGRIIAAARDVDDAAQWGGDLYRLFLVMAATGARFSQVVRLTVRDVQPERSRLMVPVSRKGKGRKSEVTPVPIGADVLAALAPAIQGRDDNEPLLMRWRHTQPPGERRWVRTSRAPWWGTQEITKPWAAIRKAADLAPDVVPYALRHSSIVRGIRAGLPLRLVAALHDTSVGMIERHYGRWIADGLDDMAARAVVPLVPV